MQQSNINILKLILTEFIQENFGNYKLEKENFRIEFDSEEIQKPKTNTDEIKFHWAIPPHIGKDLDLDTICHLLVSAHNEIPLWTKVIKEKNHFLLRTSKRFRKIKEVEKYHVENHFYPFLKY